MKKIVAAVSAGVLLVASQAVAAGANSEARVSDRVGARAAADSSGFAGTELPGWIIVLGSFVLSGVTIAAMDDDSKSN
jgi:hypothetical protein